MKIMQEGALLSASFFVVAAALAQQPATLEIDAQKPIAHVSPTLYGLMTEEINFSYDGGLYAELIRDRAIGSSRRPLFYWTLGGARRFGGECSGRRSIGAQHGSAAQHQGHGDGGLRRGAGRRTERRLSGASRFGPIRPTRDRSMPRRMRRAFPSPPAW